MPSNNLNNLTLNWPYPIVRQKSVPDPCQRPNLAVPSNNFNNLTLHWPDPNLAVPIKNLNNLTLNWPYPIVRLESVPDPCQRPNLAVPLSKPNNLTLNWSYTNQAGHRHLQT